MLSEQIFVIMSAGCREKAYVGEVGSTIAIIATISQQWLSNGRKVLGKKIRSISSKWSHSGDQI